MGGVLAKTLDLTYHGGLPYKQAQPKRAQLEKGGSDGRRPQQDDSLDQGGLTSYYTRDSPTKGTPRESCHWTLLSKRSSGIANLCRKAI